MTMTASRDDDQFSVMLPDVILIKVAGYLTPSDALALSQTSMTIYNALNLSPLLLSSSTSVVETAAAHTMAGALGLGLGRGGARGGMLLAKQLDWQGDFETGDVPRCFVEVPTFSSFATTNTTTALSKSTHSVTVTCRWVDQGWGNRKGRLWILGFDRQRTLQLQREKASIDEGNEASSCIKRRKGADNYRCIDLSKVIDAQDLEFDKGRIVAQSPIAPHDQQSLSLYFHPKERDNSSNGDGDEVYYLWYSVGSGGGHSLHVRDLQAKLLIHDDELKSATSAFRLMSKCGLLQIYLTNRYIFTSYCHDDDINVQRQRIWLLNLLGSTNWPFMPQLLLASIRTLQSEDATTSGTTNKNDFLGRVLREYGGLSTINEQALKVAEEMLQCLVEWIEFDLQRTTIGFTRNGGNDDSDDDDGEWSGSSSAEASEGWD